MPVPAILTEGLSKRYDATLALDRLDLRVEQGEVFGFLGPNGAGKTTAIRILLDLIRPTSGRAWIMGHDAQHDSVAGRAALGYLPGDLALPSNMTGRVFLDFIAAMHASPPDPTVRDDLARRLEAQLDRPIGALSTGQRQKIGLIQALMHRPPLLILDEPTSGLDPIMRQRVQDLLAEAAAEGSAVFFSSHVLAEVEESCSRVGVLRAGRLLEVFDVAEGRRLAPRRVTLTFETPVAPERFTAVDGVELLSTDGPQVTLAVADGMREIIQLAAAHAAIDMDVVQPSLEDLVLAYYGEGAPTIGSASASTREPGEAAPHASSE